MKYRVKFEDERQPETVESDTCRIRRGQADFTTIRPGRVTTRSFLAVDSVATLDERTGDVLAVETA